MGVVFTAPFNFSLKRINMKPLVSLIVNISKVIAAFSIGAGVFLAFINVVARYIFESSLTWAGELTIYLFLWSVFFGAVYCFEKDAHIAVDVFLEKVSPRLRKTFILITLIISLIYVAAIAYYGYKYVLLYIDLGEVSVDLNIPLWIPYVVVPISFAFSAIVLLNKIITVIKMPPNKIKLKSEAEVALEELGKEELLKMAHKKTGGIL